MIRKKKRKSDLEKWLSESKHAPVKKIKSSAGRKRKVNINGMAGLPNDSVLIQLQHDLCASTSRLELNKKSKNAAKTKNLKATYQVLIVAEKKRLVKLKKFLRKIYK